MVLEIKAALAELMHNIITRPVQITFIEDNNPPMAFLLPLRLIIRLSNTLVMSIFPILQVATIFVLYKYFLLNTFLLNNGLSFHILSNSVYCI